MKITHLITGLSAGGAEMMLYRLLSRMDREAFRAEVISLMGGGPVGAKIAQLGIPVRALELNRKRPNPFSMPRLACWLGKDPPDVLQTWMYHANFVGALVAPMAGGPPVVWGIHHGRLEPEIERRRTIWIARACAIMSRGLAERIVCCSESSRRAHLEMGYAAGKMVVVPNGFDLAKFRPDPAARFEFRDRLGIPQEAPVVGRVGRFHPEKDYRGFLEAAAAIRAHCSDARFVLCGDSVTWNNVRLTEWIGEFGLRDRCHLLGVVDDMAALYAGLDVLCSSSVSEAMPLVIGEAMACGVPCAVTGVGDSATLTGDTGIVVPPRQPRLLARACLTLLDMPPEMRRELGGRARARIEQNFSLDRIVARYQTIYEEVFAARHKRREAPLAHDSPVWKGWPT